MKENRLEDFIKNPEISLWKLSIPMMLGMSVQAIYTLIDTAFIGRWVGWEALAGLGVVFPALFIIMGIKIYNFKLVSFLYVLNEILDFSFVLNAIH